MNETTATLRDPHSRRCTDVTSKLDRADVTAAMAQVPRWREHVTPDHRHAIRREFAFKTFAAALAFVNRVGAIAEREGHHPDILIDTGRTVTLTLTTHAIGALSVNDFIVAAKIDRIL